VAAPVGHDAAHLDNARCGAARHLQKSPLGFHLWGTTMRGTRAVRLGNEVVYAFITTDGGATRLRVSPDECDRLDLFAGNQVRVGLGDGEPVRALVVGVTRESPFVWVAVEFAPARRGK
jgi:hypothetical protein